MSKPSTGSNGGSGGQYEGTISIRVPTTLEELKINAEQSIDYVTIHKSKVLGMIELLEGARSIVKMEFKKIDGEDAISEWEDGTLGWHLPSNLQSQNKRYSYPAKIYTGDRQWIIGDKSYLCKITIEAVKNARMRRVK